MTNSKRAIISFSIMALLLVLVGYGQAWNVALAILNLCLISAVMSMGLNMQWGYAGLFNAGVMASTAVGGLAAVLISYSPVGKAWDAGGTELGIAFAALVVTIVLGLLVWKRMRPGRARSLSLTAVVLVGYGFMRFFFRRGLV